MSKNKFINTGAFMKKKDGGYYIKLDKETKVVIDGTEFTGGYISVNKPADKYDRMIVNAEKKLQEGEINEEEYDKQLEDLQAKAARYDKGGDLDYIKFELTAVRPE